MVGVVVPLYRLVLQDVSWRKGALYFTNLRCETRFGTRGCASAYAWENTYYQGGMDDVVSVAVDEEAVVVSTSVECVHVVITLPRCRLRVRPQGSTW